MKFRRFFAILSVFFACYNFALGQLTLSHSLEGSLCEGSETRITLSLTNNSATELYNVPVAISIPSNVFEGITFSNGMQFDYYNSWLIDIVPANGTVVGIIILENKTAGETGNFSAELSTNLSIRTDEIITIKQNPIVIATDSIICKHSSALLFAFSDMPGMTYQWLLDNKPIFNYEDKNHDGDTIRAFADDDIIYTVRGIAPNGCTATAESKLTVKPLPDMEILPEISEICVGDTITLFAKGCIDYHWWNERNHLISAVNGVTIYPRYTQYYTVEGLGENGCSQSVIKRITVHRYPQLSPIVPVPMQKICSEEMMEQVNLKPFGSLLNTYPFPLDDDEDDNGQIFTVAQLKAMLLQLFTELGAPELYNVFESQLDWSNIHTLDDFEKALEDLKIFGEGKDIEYGDPGDEVKFRWELINNGVDGVTANSLSGFGEDFIPADILTLEKGRSTIGTAIYRVRAYVPFTETPFDITTLGCYKGVDSVIIHVKPLPEVLPIDPQEICSESTTAEIILKSSLGAGSTFQWWVETDEVTTGASDGEGLSIPPTVLFFEENADLQQGTVTYSVLAKHDGCEGKDTTLFDIKVNPLPKIDKASLQKQTICSSEQTLETVISSTPAGNTYIWTVMQDGVTGARNSLDSTAVSVPATQFILENGRTVFGTALYEITPISNKSCAGMKDTLEIQVNPLPEINVDFKLKDTICSGYSTNKIILSSTPKGAIFSWTVTQNNVTGAIDGTGNEIPAAQLTTLSDAIGTVTYNITPKLGDCEGNMVSVEIAVKPLPATKISYSNGSNIPIITGQTGGKFTAEGLTIDENTGKIDTTNIQPGSYKIIYSYSNGMCDGADSTTITIKPNIGIIETSIEYNSNTFCAEGTAFVTQKGEVGGYYISVPAGLSIAMNTGEINLANSLPNTYTVIYLFDDGNSTATTKVTIYPMPKAEIKYEKENPILTGQNGGKYKSTAGLIIDENTGEIDLINSADGNYTIIYSFSNGYCNDSTAAFVTINNHQITTTAISYDLSPYCAKDTAYVTLTGTPGGKFTAAPAGLDINEDNGKVNLATSLSGTYTVFYTLGSNYTDTKLTIRERLNAYILPQDQKTCDGKATGQLTLTIKGGMAPYQYYWYNFGGTEIARNTNANELEQVPLTGLPSDNYTVWITDNCGAVKMFTANIGSKPNIKLLPQLINNDMGAVCLGDTFELDVANGEILQLTDYLWEYSEDNGISWQELSRESILKDIANPVRLYRISSETAGVCTETSDAFALTVKQPLIDDLHLEIVEIDESAIVEGQHITIRPGGTVSLAVSTSNNVSVQWFENDNLIAGTNEYFERQYKDKTIKAAMSENVCQQHLEQSLQVKVPYPTAITPYTADGLNDDFLPDLGCNFIIFNRYGQKVYEDKGKDGWNGTYKGKLADPVAYFYVIYLPGGDIKKGTIEVVKIK